MDESKLVGLVLRDVFEFSKARGFRFGKNKWYVIRDIGKATGVRFRVVGDVVDDLIEEGLIEVKEKYGRQYLFLTKVGRDVLFEKYGNWKERVLINLEKKNFVILVVGYREGDYWDVADKLYSVLDWNRDVVENWMRNVYLDEYGWWIVVPRDVGERIYDELKDSIGGVKLEVGESAVNSWVGWTMYVGYMADDVGGGWK